MEPLLNKRNVSIMQRVLNAQEECPLSGEYVLPEYLPDVAVILKCFAYPRIQSRQWTSDQLLVDGVAIIRVLYLDEERRCVHALEFPQSFSCGIRGTSNLDNAVSVSLVLKYLNCRAVSPRRVEVRGAVLVNASAECATPCEIVVPQECESLYTQTDTVCVTVPGSVYEKVLTISESLEFDRSLPPAEMLLGGECRAVVKECKLLTGKAIVKGSVYVHQLYKDRLDGEQTHCLDFTIPFSQILDVGDAREGDPCKVSVCVLSDTERCLVGPDGENTVLEITAKLLLQFQVHRCEEMAVLKDVFHSCYPVSTQTEEREWTAFLAQRFEEVKVPLQLSVPSARWQEILDVWVVPMAGNCECGGDSATLKGHLQIGVIARDTDGEIVCSEHSEEYVVRCTCSGNSVEMQPTVADVRYRAVEERLEMEVGLVVDVMDCKVTKTLTVTDLSVCEDKPYSVQKASVIVHYAMAGETVWDIARQCHTSPMSIREENELHSEIIDESRVLIVPIVH